MSVVGIGLDIVCVSRIAAVHARRGDRFLRRILTESELADFVERKSSGRSAQFLASRFAVKEAVYKALFPHRVSWKDIRLRPTDGKPALIIDGRLKEALHSAGARGIHLSLSHDGDYASAFVVATAAT